jgi:hypothetical protein
MDLRTFYNECVKRKVFKGISIYAISSWVIIQVAATTFPYLGFPNEAVTTVIIMVLICLPISIVFSWHYNVVPEPEEESKSKDLRKKKQSNSLFYSIIAVISLLMMVVIFMISRKNFTAELDPDFFSPADFTSDQIAILQFKNNSTDPNLDVTGKMVADWISHGLIQYEVAPVLNYESINQLASIGMQSNILQSNLSGLNKITPFAKVIQGAIFLNGNEIIFQSSITNNEDGKQFAFPPVKCLATSPLDGIEKIKQQILSYFLGPQEDVSSSYIPLYDAYREFIIAKDYWRKDYNLADIHLDKALEIDSNLYQAAYYKVGLYYNLRLYSDADSLVNVYTRRFETAEQHKDLFVYFRYLIDGRYKAGFRTFQKIYAQQPSDIFDNTLMLVMMYNFLNQTEELDNVYNLIRETELDFNKCNYCISRLRIKALTEIDKGKAEEAEIMLEKNLDKMLDYKYWEVYIKALVHQGKYDKLNSVFGSSTFRLLKMDDQAYLEYSAARYAELVGNREVRNKYAAKALITYQKDNHLIMQARCYYLMEDYLNAMEFFKAKNEATLINSSMPHSYSLSRMAAINYLNGNNESGDKFMNQLKESIQKYDYGMNAYLQAHVYAKREDKVNAMEQLEIALLQGKLFGILYFQNDPHLRKYLEDEEFKNLLNYWH